MIRRIIIRVFEVIWSLFCHVPFKMLVKYEALTIFHVYRKTEVEDWFYFLFGWVFFIQLTF